MSETQIEIDVDDKQPAEQKKSSVRKRKPKLAKVQTPAKKMLEALNFIMPAQSKIGTVENRHCAVINGWIIASTDKMLIAHPIEGMINCCPSSAKLKSALGDCGEDLSISDLDENYVSISSGDFRAVVPCTQLEKIKIYNPDPQIGEMGDEVKLALSKVYAITDEKKAANPSLGVVLLQNNTCVATMGSLLLEAWHGVHLPDNILLPKIAAQAVAKSKVPLAGFGFSETSFTFYFENGAFLKTGLVDTRYPAYEKLFALQNEATPWEVPDNFFSALKSITPFSKDNFVHFKENYLTSDTLENEASTFKLEGIPIDVSIAIKNLTLIKNFFANVRFTERTIFFSNDNVRGVTALARTKAIEEEDSV